MALPVDGTDLSRAVAATAASDEPLDRVVAALAVQAELEALGAEVVQRVVAEARDAGCSWSAIGRALGVTKQAVQQRFSASAERRSTPAAEPVARLFERAVEVARGEGRRQVEPPHLLTALLPDPAGPRSLAAAALARLGVAPSDAAGSEGAMGAGAARVARSSAVGALVDRARALAAARGAAAADSGDVVLAVAEAETVLAGWDAGLDPDAVAGEVARLRRWGFTDV